MLASFAVAVLLARVLGAEQFGAYTLALAIATLLALPAGGGVAPLLTRELARYEYAADWPAWAGATRRALAFAAALALLCAGLYVAFALWAAGSAFYWAALAVPALALAKVLSGLQQGARRPVLAQWPEMLVRPLTLLLLLAALAAAGALTLGHAAASFACAAWLALVVGGVLAGRTAARRLASGGQGSPTYEDRRWLAALLPFTGIVAINTLNAEAFVPLLAWLSSVAEVGIFKVALSIALLVGTPLIVVEAVIRGDVARLYAAGEAARLRRLLRLAAWGSAALSLPLLAIVWLWGEALLVGVFGADFAASYRPLLVLVCGFVVSNVVGPSMQLLYATDFESDALRVSLASLFVVVLCALVWIPEYGALGAAWAFALGKAGRAVTFKLWAEHRLRRFFAAATQDAPG